MAMRESVIFKVAADTAGLERDMAKAESIVNKRIQSTLKGRSNAERTMARERLSLDDAINRRLVNNDAARHQIRMRRIAAENKAMAAGSGGFGWIGREKEALKASTSGHGGVGGAGGVGGELMVMGREAMAGRFSRMGYSMSVLAQRTGLLGKAFGALVSPIGAVVASVVGAGVIMYSYAQNATHLIRAARAAGFSTKEFQDFTRKSDRYGEGEASREGLGSLISLIGGAQSGDEGAYKKFRGRGIDISGKSNAEIYQEVVNKIKSESPSRRRKIGEEFFGSNFLGMEQTIMGGIASDNDGPKYTDNELRRLHQLNPTGKTLGQHFMGGLSKLGTLGGKIVASVIPGGAFDQEARSAENYRELVESFEKRKPINVLSGLSKLGTEGEEMRLRLQGASLRQEESQASLDDRGKGTLADLAEKGRKFTGQIHRKNYSVTERMRTALKIQDLEEQANVAWEKGDDKGMQKFREQADSMRKANPWLAYGDKNPTKVLEQQSAQANVYLKVTAEMADLMIKGHKAPI